MAGFLRFITRVPQVHVAPNLRKTTICAASEQFYEHALETNPGQEKRMLRNPKRGKPQMQ
jgi:hypothetical protein